jgi:hypothetical protein
MDRENAICDEPAKPQNYNMLGSFSESMATPCRISAELLNPDQPREVPGKQTTLRAYIPYIEGTTDRISRLLQKHDIHTVQKPINKMASGFNSTKDRQLPTKKSGVYKILCSCGRTGHHISTRITEHIRDTRLENQ